MKLIKTRHGRFIRLHIWGAFWEHKGKDKYEYPHVCLTRKEAREAANFLHVMKGTVKRVWVEWETADE